MLNLSASVPVKVKVKSFTTSSWSVAGCRSYRSLIFRNRQDFVRCWGRDNRCIIDIRHRDLDVLTRRQRGRPAIGSPKSELRRYCPCRRQLDFRSPVMRRRRSSPVPGSSVKSALSVPPPASVVRRYVSPLSSASPSGSLELASAITADAAVFSGTFGFATAIAGVSFTSSTTTDNRDSVHGPRKIGHRHSDFVRTIRIVVAGRLEVWGTYKRQHTESANLKTD